MDLVKRIRELEKLDGRTLRNIVIGLESKLYSDYDALDRKFELSCLSYSDLVTLIISLESKLEKEEEKKMEEAEEKKTEETEDKPKSGRYPWKSKEEDVSDPLEMFIRSLFD